LPEIAEMLGLIVASSPVATQAIDLDRRVVLWNPASERTFGWSSSEVIGKPLPDAMIPRADRAASAERIRRTLAGAQINGERVRRLTKSGEERWIDIYAARLVDDDGQPIGVAGQLVDVTERVRLEAELLQAQKMAAVGLLASGIAHDFSNTLTAAGGFAELIRDQSEGQVAADAAAIVDAVERGRALTRQLLGFARGADSIDGVVDVRDVVARLEGLIRRLVGESVVVELRLAEEPVHTRVQVAQLEHALINLAVNARDAMPRGGVLTICVRRLVDEAVIEVADTGVGIPASNLAAIFEPFFTTKPVGQGTGLGLAMVRGFVENAAGRLSVRSDPGQGATFSMWLPIVSQTIGSGIV
jgi:two-component system cell cycle sensor histidine kinase/response regulator CckA